MGGHDTGWRLAGLALAFIAGTALQLHERGLLPVAYYAAAILAGTLALAAAWRWRRLFVFALLGLAAIGFGSAGWRAAERLG